MHTAGEVTSSRANSIYTHLHTEGCWWSGAKAQDPRSSDYGMSQVAAVSVVIYTSQGRNQDNFSTKAKI